MLLVTTEPPSHTSGEPDVRAQKFFLKDRTTGKSLKEECVGAGVVVQGAKLPLGTPMSHTRMLGLSPYCSASNPAAYCCTLGGSR